DPAMAVDIYRGDAGLDTGTAQSIFDLDTSLVHSGQLQRIDRVNLTLDETDRKSTRLNSSHVSISYAVFCLKKKKQRDERLKRTDGRGENGDEQRRRLIVGSARRRSAR